MTSLILEELRDQQLEAGDVIWKPGHVMIVGSIEKNELLEAAGYPNGFGRVQCLTLSERFGDINTYQDLVDAYRKKQKLISLNSQGHPVHIEDFKIFKFV